jgi:hypothetical protein
VAARKLRAAVKKADASPRVKLPRAAKADVKPVAVAKADVKRKPSIERKERLVI